MGRARQENRLGCGFSPETRSRRKIVSVFDRTRKLFAKGKASKPTEFGKLVKIQEVEIKIVTHFEVFAERLMDSALLLPSIEVHQQRLGRIPRYGRRCGILFEQNEKAGQSVGGAVDVGAQQENLLQRMETSSTPALVS